MGGCETGDAGDLERRELQVCGGLWPVVAKCSDHLLFRRVASHPEYACGVSCGHGDTRWHKNGGPLVGGVDFVLLGSGPCRCIGCGTYGQLVGVCWLWGGVLGG